MQSYEDSSDCPRPISCTCEACCMQKSKEQKLKELKPEKRSQRPIQMAFGRALRDLREQRRWSIDDLCGRVHYEPIGIELYERGMQNPALGVLVVLSHAFGISPVEFMVRINHHLSAL